MSTPRSDELAAGLSAVRARVDAACTAAGRRAADVTLITVTKFFPAADAAELARLGSEDLGESREQEATAKVVDCAGLLDTSDLAPRWHMLGSIQRNKARAIARWAHSAHSVDSARLATALGAAAVSAADEGARSAPLDAYLQVSLDGDPARGGVAADQLDELADLTAGTTGLRLAGLMAVPPIGVEPTAAFARLAEIASRMQSQHPGATGISAGMSADLEAAIAHGSTCVRVGTAILGPRPITSQ
ncbi:YggS family pyridoxal phosphate-dependent enzyme [Tomitella biformata]|uniref:YggS family pyridoxal phosphate-dependent enzyme n=1 Tax=Tomitella biformata TaxID=630403 RepID=UPI0004647157|nr:YggS family pyridoxal phosphate-dependent enzyme [Tomitella biformata]